MTTNLEQMLGNATETEARLERAMKALGVRFANLDLLELALVHRSHLNERGIEGSDSVTESNERLEFLGDALLGFVSAEYVYEQFPTLPEGELTVYRVSLVRTETLAQWAREFGLDELLYMARGEYGPDGQVRDRILAGAFEAVVGALYLDQGIEQATDFLRRLLAEDAPRIIDTSQQTNYKGRLQELIQERNRMTPTYRTVETSGPAHDRYFVVDVVLQGDVLGTGGGASKRAAQQEAARNALARIEQNEGIVAADGRDL
jgi:ribonuclease III